MKRFAVFAVLGPCLAGMLLVLPVATWLEGVRSTPVGRPGFDGVPRQHLPGVGGRPVRLDHGNHRVAASAGRRGYRGMDPGGGGVARVSGDAGFAGDGLSPSA
jgi:hypothetical protein